MAGNTALGAKDEMLTPQTYTWWRGPWPLYLTMILVALLNLGVLLQTGHPWW